MGTFLTPQIISELNGAAERLATLQQRWPAEIALPTTDRVSIYDCHPWLFADAFPAVGAEQLRTLSLAVRLFANAWVPTAQASEPIGGRQAEVLSLARLQAWQLEASIQLQKLFAADSPFWIRLRQLIARFVRALIAEQDYVAGRLPWKSYREVARDVAINANGLGRISIEALAELAHHYEPVERLTLALNEVSFAARMLGDLDSWREHLARGTPSLLLTRLLDDAPPLDDPAAMRELLAELEGRVSQSVIAREILIESLNALHRADAAIYEFPAIAWRGVIEMCRKNCLIALESHAETICAAGPLTPVVVVEKPCADHRISDAAWRGLRFLLREWSGGFTEAAHVMPFPKSQGFIGQQEEQFGDVFERALIADTLCDFDEALAQQLSTVIACEIDKLLASRRTNGVGGWSYFPDLPELPADADDLAQVMQVLLRGNRRDAVAAHCERPLAVLLSDNRGPDGQLETWIIPDERDAALALQSRWVEMAWGAGPDGEVMANLLYALAVYDAERFAEVIEKGARFIISAQQSDGSWESTWYHGPFYGTWVCNRLLNRVAPTSPSLVRARDFIARRQMSDGGWGLGDRSDALSTALALLALLKPQGAEANDQEKALAAIRWLARAQEDDGGWPAAPFIRMELGRATGDPWQTLTYESRTISTAFAAKALLAWAQGAAPLVGYQRDEPRQLAAK